MKPADAFREAARSFNGAEFSKEELKAKYIELVDGGENDNHFNNYFADFRRGTANIRFRILQVNEDLYVTDETEAAEDVILNSSHPATSDEENADVDDIVSFEKQQISDEDALKFFIYTLKMFYKKGENKYRNHPKFKDLKDKDKTSKVQKELDRYFQRSDKDLLDPKKKLKDIPFIYKQLAFHAQNGSNILDIIKFYDHNTPESIKRTTHNFNVKDELESYEVFRNLCGNASEKLLRSYYNCLNTIRLFLKDLRSLEEVKQLFLPPENERTPLDFYNKFHSAVLENINAGKGQRDRMHNVPRYGEALTFDFLKEFGKVFDYKEFDFPKPDLHVKRTMIWLFNKEENMEAYRSDVKGFDEEKSINSFDAIDLYLELMGKVNSAYKNKARGKNVENISNYYLDKAIYVVCSACYYLLDKKKNTSEKEYITGVANKDYLKEEVDMAWLDSFLQRMEEE